jgi:AcrR family transcriptional regulator
MKRQLKQGDQKAAARKAILEAAAAVTVERRGGPITTELVATRARCAKGLVHYHFTTKEALLAEVAARLWGERAEQWRAALAVDDATQAIGTAWTLLQAEATDGLAPAAAWLGMLDDKLVVQSVNNGRTSFVAALSDALAGLLMRMRLQATVPVAELAALLAATTEGLGLRMAGGAAPGDLEPAWAAFWVGLLSLTRTAPR